MSAISTSVLSAAVISLLSSLIVAVITAVVTVRLALRRFYSEKWWERKSGAYTAIIESMHHLRERADTHFVFQAKGRKLPPEDEELRDRNLRQALADLRRYRDVGSFVISEAATSLLTSLFQALGRAAEAHSVSEYLRSQIEAIDKSLEEMRRVARKDLSLPSAPRRLRLPRSA